MSKFCHQMKIPTPQSPKDAQRTGVFLGCDVGVPKRPRRLFETGVFLGCHRASLFAKYRLCFSAAERAIFSDFLFQLCNTQSDIMVIIVFQIFFRKLSMFVNSCAQFSQHSATCCQTYHQQTAIAITKFRSVTLKTQRQISVVLPFCQWGYYNNGNPTDKNGNTTDSNTTDRMQIKKIITSL